MTAALEIPRIQYSLYYTFINFYIFFLEKIKTFVGSVGAFGGQQNLFYTEVEDSMRIGDGGGLAHEVNAL